MLQVIQAMHTYEINIIEIIQSIRTPFLDSFFHVLNIFDNDLTYFVIIILLWHLVSEKAGFRLLYLQVINIIFLLFLKNYFAQPRPYDLLPSLKIVGTSGYGFPSGAASAILVSFGFIFFLQKPMNFLLKMSAVCMILLVGLTRIYLGAHFPTDVMGGYAVGMLILSAYACSINLFEKKMYLIPKYQQLFLHGAVIFFLSMLYFSQNAAFLLAVLSGAIVWHLFFNQRLQYRVINYHSTVLKYASILVTLIGVIFLMGIVHTVSNYIPNLLMLDAIRFTIGFLMGMWLGLSSYILFFYKRIKSK